MQYVAYYRVSTQMQGKSGLGLEAQRSAVTAFVGSHPILAEFTEVESGNRMQTLSDDINKNSWFGTGGYNGTAKMLDAWLGGTNFAGPKAVAAPSAEAVEQSGRGFAPLRNAIVGETDDAATIAQRAQDFRDIGAEPTTGMVSGSQRAALKENALLPTRAGREIQQRIDDAFTAQENEFGRLSDGLASRTNPEARPSTRADIGQALQEQAQRVRDAQVKRASEMYDEVGNMTGDAIATGEASRRTLAALQEQKANLSNSAKLTEGPQLNKAIKHAEAMVKDLDAGATFADLKRARTALGEITADKAINPVLKGHLQNIRNALTDDMSATATATSKQADDAWKAANKFYKGFKDRETGFGRGSDAAALLDKDADAIFSFVNARNAEGGNRLNTLRSQITKEGGQETWDRLDKHPHHAFCVSCSHNRRDAFSASHRNTS